MTTTTTFRIAGSGPKTHSLCLDERGDWREEERGARFPTKERADAHRRWAANVLGTTGAMRSRIEKVRDCADCGTPTTAPSTSKYDPALRCPPCSAAWSAGIEI